MGVVYRATDTRLGRMVAVKVIQPGYDVDPAAKLQFERDARADSALSHPGICNLFDVGEQEGVQYLVMEFVEGETLADRLKERPASPRPTCPVRRPDRGCLNFASRPC